MRGRTRHGNRGRGRLEQVGRGGMGETKSRRELKGGRSEGEDEEWKVGGGREEMTRAGATRGMRRGRRRKSVTITAIGSNREELYDGREREDAKLIGKKVGGGQGKWKRS